MLEILKKNQVSRRFLMAAEKALALVVRGSDWSETSRITTLFTREVGKIRALAKGGRRLRSSFDAAFDLLSVIHVVYLRSRSHGLDLLTEARLEERFPALRTNLKALYVGYYIAELLSEGTQDYDPHPELFDLALESLRNLGGAADLRAVAAHFELVWLQELGYGPRLEACAGCGSEVNEAMLSPFATYSAALGGVLCSACAVSARDPRRLGVSAWRTLRQLSREMPGELQDFGPVWQDLRPLLGQLVSQVLGKRPRMLAYVDAA